MHRLSSGLTLLVAIPILLGVPLHAQLPERDSLERRVLERFLDNYGHHAGLSDEQRARLREFLVRSFRERTEFRRQERDVWRALEGQMRPGVAADEDSLRALLDGLVAMQGRWVERLRVEQQALAEFLSPVQRAQFALAFRRFQMQLQRVGGRRMPPEPMRRPMRRP